MDTERERILVVDDEESIRLLLKQMLEDCGYSVVTAVDGEDALRKLSLEEVRIVLLDITMPKLSGIEVLKNLSERLSDYCVIMITATADITTAVDILKLGAYDYITKPFDQEEVKRKVLESTQKWHGLLQEKQRYVKLSEGFREQTQRMQEQFAELVKSLAREHKLMMQSVANQPKASKELLARLPKELQVPMSTVEEFRDALIRILKGTSL
ncbi:MAG: response regulator [Dehalococcoidales bacterium]|nr:response regulator [Dehalococcoidales bacterium]